MKRLGGRIAPRIVHSYPLDVNSDSVTHEIPEGAVFMGVVAEGYQLRLWAEIDPHAEMVRRHFVVLGLGDAVPNENNGCYIGSAFVGGAGVRGDNQGAVWHVYMVWKNPDA